ncbi:hypothetical protein BSKO_05251 [Bryopsis sp. KO-2023]|nr:hypothetical protein BSKO_05251 [Bryopsis sp. KO-2023]
MSRVDVVFGAGGPTGRVCVERLLSLGGTVRAVVRSPEKYADVFRAHANLEVVRGDVTDKESVKSCLKGAQGVIFAVSAAKYFDTKTVDNESVGTVAACSKEAGVERVVLISSALATRKNRFKPLRIVLNKIRWKLMDHKFQGEEKLRNSGVKYTVIRPGHLTDKPMGGSILRTVQGDKTSSGDISVSRSNVAVVCCAALTDPKTENRTFELFSKDSDTCPSVDQQLLSLFDNLEAGHDQ